MATRGRKVLMTCKCGGNFVVQTPEVSTEGEEFKVLLVCDKCGKAKKVLAEKVPVVDSKEKTED